MTGKRVVLTASARGDLDDIFEWLADKAGRRKAHAIVREIRRSAESLAILSERGAPR